jgi:hypothetical protein
VLWCEVQQQTFVIRWLVSSRVAWCEFSPQVLTTHAERAKYSIYLIDMLKINVALHASCVAVQCPLASAVKRSRIAWYCDLAAQTHTPFHAEPRTYTSNLQHFLHQHTSFSLYVQGIASHSGSDIHSLTWHSFTPTFIAYLNTCDLLLSDQAQYSTSIPQHLNISKSRYPTRIYIPYFKMSHNTPDTLLKLAAELNKLGGELTTVGGKLAQAAKALEEEAANVALANAQRWGVDVQVSRHSIRWI